MPNYDEAQRLTAQELELQSTDTDNFPYIKQRGMLYWTGTAWAKWDGSITATSLPLPTGAATSAKQDDLSTKIGEVQASPTANTVLARLKDIVSYINFTNGIISDTGVAIKNATDSLINPATENTLTDVALAAEAIYTSAGATLGSDTTAIKTAVQLIDNAVDGNYLNINNNIAGTDVAAGAGTVNAQTQRVTLGSNDPAVTALQLIDNAISGNEMQVDVVTSALPSGASTEATLAKLPGLSIPIHDYISRGWVAGTFTETWTFKTGGSGGTTVATVTIVYDDVNKSNPVSVTKT